jgi:hypothetical protein
VSELTGNVPNDVGNQMRHLDSAPQKNDPKRDPHKPFKPASHTHEISGRANL